MYFFNMYYIYISYYMHLFSILILVVNFEQFMTKMHFVTFFILVFFYVFSFIFCIIVSFAFY